MSTSTPIEQIVLVGHCYADIHLLKSAVRTLLGEVPVVTAADTEALKEVATPQSLLLVNRVLEMGYDTDSGIELIRSLAGQPHAPRMMLISNYEDAQAAAIEAGAFPGFGKGQIGKPQTRERLMAAMN